MDKKIIKEKLEGKLKKQNLILDCPMAKYTTFRCGGNAGLLVICENIDELSFVVSVANAFKEKLTVLGNGSNTLFTDGGFDGIVIKLSGEFNEIVFDGNEVYVGASASLPYLSKVAMTYGLSGLETLCGIPASVGGALCMNAGAYDHTISEVVVNVTAMTREGDILLYDISELEYAYRHSLFMDNGDIILSCKLRLDEGDQALIQRLMDECTEKRKAKQPLSYPSAGSFFKRPEGHFAGALIENAGLKGTKVGGAEVSTLHAGFLINSDNASASDVLDLCKLVQNTVNEKYGVMLEPEVRILGE